LRSVVLDASVVVALCAKEPHRAEEAEAALQERERDGWTFHAPNALVSEAQFILCRKAALGSLTQAEYTAALAILQAVLSVIAFLPEGDGDLLTAAERIRHGYGCSRCADSTYIALAERLSGAGPVELLTFDTGQRSQAAATAPLVTVTVLGAQSDESVAHQTSRPC